MIQHIKLLRNIGTFNSDSAAASLDLKRITLIYADNARGKTTLAAVFRSLATGDPLPITERQRLGSQQSPHVLLDCESEPSNVMFQNDAWNRTLPNLKIFDDVFVDGNVHSGLDVEAHHRKNLHELILGDEGVTLSRRLQDIVTRINQHNTALEEKSKAILEQRRGVLPVDEFCALTKQPEIETRIERAERELKAARNQDDVRTKPLFEAIGLPKFDVVAIMRILSTDLPDLDKAAEAQVQAHVQTLGEGGESWVADGMRRMSRGNDEVCPFCGQDFSGLDLIAHYRAYFSEGYAKLKQDVAKMIENMDNTHADGAQGAFERVVGTARQTEQFWAHYCDISPMKIDTEVIAQDWNAARETVTGILKTKQAAPLERQELNDYQLNILRIYDAHRQEINVVNERLTISNDAIREVQKQADVSNIEEILTRLNQLNATTARFSQEIAPLCVDYLQEKEAKRQTEAERAAARKALDGYRANMFRELQSGVNGYLQDFNAGFRIGSLTPTNIGSKSGSACTYNVVINDMPIAVKGGSNSQGEPSFRNSMSAGDRNMLALALFFSSLDQNSNLADTIVVIDDPMSSLDDHRSLATIHAVRNLAERAGQVILLSHNKRFLCSIWRGADHNHVLPLEIAQCGNESTIRRWDVSQDAITEHDQRHILLQKFAATQAGTKKEVAAAIRPHLEGYIRVVCPGSFPPGKTLGQFIDSCCRKFGTSGEVLNKTKTQELRKINEYGKQFHHVSTPPSEISATELLGFVRRTLAFVGPSGG